MQVGVWHIVGILLILVLIAVVGLWSGRRVNNAKDFTTGNGKAGAWLVCGTIMGSLVGGQATVGTVQMAFSFGISAWWFTLGAGLGCIVLAIGYVVPLRHSGDMTLLQIIGEEYGSRSESIASVLCSVGIFISVISNVLAFTALLTALFPIDVYLAAGISVIVMAVYVIFGGVWGTGMGGVTKLILLYIASLIGFILVLTLSGGFRGIMNSLCDAVSNNALGELYGFANRDDVSDYYLNPVARGAMKDIGSGLSLIMGVLSTQTYAQAIWSAKSNSKARKGALLSGFLVPPIGIACILIGFYMRGHYITSDEISALAAAGQIIPQGLTEISSSAQAFPVFILDHLPPLLGGAILGTLLLTVAGGGAGLSLGVATILVNDIFYKMKPTAAEGSKGLVLTRVTLVGILLASAIVASLVPGAIINDFGFLSMGFRGAAVLVPLTCALFFPGRVESRWALAAIVLGPLPVLIGNLFELPFDPLFLGVGVSLFLVAIGERYKQYCSGGNKK